MSLVRKAEILVFMGKAASLTQADEALLDLIKPLAEARLTTWLQQNLSLQQYVEYLPIGRPRMINQPPLSQNYTLNDVDFRSTSAIFLFGQGGNEFLQLKNTPVSLVGLEVKEDVGGYGGQFPDSFGDDKTLLLGTDYYLDIDDPVAQTSKSGILYRVGIWPVEPRSVKVSYFGGYSAAQLNSTVAGDIKLACLHTIGACYWKAKNLAKNNGLGPYMSEGIGKYNYSVNPNMIFGNITFDVPIDAQSILAPYRNWGRLFG